MSSQRPFFLSGFWAALRQQPTSSLTSAAASQQPPNKHTSQATTSGPSTYGSSSTVARAVSSAAAQAASSNSSSSSSNNTALTSPGTGPSSPSAGQTRSGGVYSQFPSYHHHHSPRTTTTTGHGIPIPRRPGSGRRRGSDSSSEGFRDVLGAEKLYIGGRTATGEEKFFRLGVVRRVRSGDRLSLDRLSL